MGQLKWGGKTFYPQSPKPIKSDINELMKPLSEKVDKGNVWGSIIMNVPEESAVPVSPTPSATQTATPTPTPTLTPTPSPVYYWLLAESGDALMTELSENLEYEY